MNSSTSKKRDFASMQRRRMRAARLLEQGYRQAEVARRVGVSREAVRQWLQALKQGGCHALKGAGRAGRCPRLTSSQVAPLSQALKRGPQALGYRTPLWTLDRVADLIKQQTGLSYHPGHVWRILRSLGWSCQRPTGRALERDEQAIRRWKQSDWPAIKKKPSVRGGLLSLSTKAV